MDKTQFFREKIPCNVIVFKNSRKLIDKKIPADDYVTYNLFIRKVWQFGLYKS